MRPSRVLQANLVAAFEQSLVSMTSRLRHLAETAEEKVRRGQGRPLPSVAPRSEPAAGPLSPARRNAAAWHTVELPHPTVFISLLGHRAAGSARNHRLSEEKELGGPGRHPGGPQRLGSHAQRWVREGRADGRGGRPCGTAVVDTRHCVGAHTPERGRRLCDWVTGQVRQLEQMRPLVGVLTAGEPRPLLGFAVDLQPRAHTPVQSGSVLIPVL